MARRIWISSIRAMTAVLVAVLSIAHADEAAVADAHAVETGMFLGGAATQFDTCIKKGFLPPTTVPAEDQVAAYLKKMGSSDRTTYEGALKGWSIAKEVSAKQAPDWWKDNCPRIAQQWKTYERMFGQPQ